MSMYIEDETIQGYIRDQIRSKTVHENSNNTSKLECCPFCGKSTVKIIPFNNKFVISHWHTNLFDCPIATHDEETGIGVICFNTEEEAIESWNHRV